MASTECEELTFEQALKKMDTLFKNLEKETAGSETLSTHDIQGKVKKCSRAIRMFTQNLSFFMDSKANKKDAKTRLMFTPSEKQKFRIIRTLMQEHLSLKLQSLKMAELQIRLKNIFEMCGQIKCLDRSALGQRIRNETSKLLRDLSRSQHELEQKNPKLPDPEIKQPTQQRIESALFLIRILKIATQTLQNLQTETNAVEAEIAEYGSPFAPAVCVALIQRMISAKLQYTLMTQNLLSICVASTGVQVNPGLLRFDSLHSAADWKTCVAVERVTQLAALLVRPRLCVKSVRSIYGEVRTLENCFSKKELNIQKVISMLKDYTKVALYNAASIVDAKKNSAKALQGEKDMMTVYELLEHRMKNEPLTCNDRKDEQVKVKIEEKREWLKCRKAELEATKKGEKCKCRSCYGQRIPTNGSCLDLCRAHEDLSQPLLNSDLHYNDFFTAEVFKRLLKYQEPNDGFQGAQKEYADAARNLNDTLVGPMDRMIPRDTLKEIAAVLSKHYCEPHPKTSEGAFKGASEGKKPSGPAPETSAATSEAHKTQDADLEVQSAKTECTWCADEQEIKRMLNLPSCTKIVNSFEVSDLEKRKKFKSRWKEFINIMCKMVQQEFSKLAKLD